MCNTLDLTPDSRLVLVPVSTGEEKKEKWKRGKKKEKKQQMNEDSKRVGDEGACHWLKGPGHAPGTGQMYVLQPDNGPSRTRSGSPAALLDLVFAIVNRAFFAWFLLPVMCSVPIWPLSIEEKKKTTRYLTGFISINNICHSKDLVSS